MDVAVVDIQWMLRGAGAQVSSARGPIESLEAPLILCAIKSNCLLAKCSYSVSKYDLCKDQLSANLGLKHLYIFGLCCAKS